VTLLNPSALKKASGTPPVAIWIETKGIRVRGREQSMTQVGTTTSRTRQQVAMDFKRNQLLHSGVDLGDCSIHLIVGN
jgi:hypothetical protein